MYTTSIKLFEITVKKRTDEGVFAIDQEGKDRFFSNRQLKDFFKTEEKAIISYYLKTATAISKEISKLKKEILEKEDKLEMLHQEFGHLKEKHPEEFI